MNPKHLRTLQQIADFLHASASLRPAPAPQAERYQWIEATLRHFRYTTLPRRDKGLVIAYLGAITGYSRQQLTRLIRRYRDQGRLRWEVRPAHGFRTRYSEVDIVRLAELDRLHDTPSGPAVKKLCERAWLRFGDARFERLASISASHLYNLRHSRSYRVRRRGFEKTRAVARRSAPDAGPTRGGAPASSASIPSIRAIRMV